MTRAPIVFLAVVGCGPAPTKAPAPARPAHVSAPSPQRPQLWIPAGPFVRYQEDGDTHTVALDGFAIDQDLVSDAEYEVCVRAGVCKRAPGRGTVAQGTAIANWYDAAAFCRFVGRRLPTPDEWDRAVFPPGPDQVGAPPGELDHNCYDDGSEEIREHRECVPAVALVEAIADSTSPAIVPAPIDTPSQDGVLHGDAGIYNVFIAGRQWVATAEEWADVSELESPYDRITNDVRQLRGGEFDQEYESAWRMWRRVARPGSWHVGDIRCASNTLQVAPRRVAP